MFARIKAFAASRLANSYFVSNYKSCVFQCALIFLTLTPLLFSFRYLGGVTAASLGATSFIVFALPRAEGSRAKHVIGGYFCGTVSGFVCNLLFEMIAAEGLAGHLAAAAVCAAAAALAVLFMAAADMGHPPAAAFALGMAFDGKCLRTAAAALIGAAVLCAVRSIFGSGFINLLKDNVKK